MKYLEDFHPGQRIAFGSHVVTKEAIVGFAEAFDPQVFHTDDTHPVTQELGGLMASGWHTAAIFMRLAVEAYLEQSAVLTSPGVDELKWRDLSDTERVEKACLLIGSVLEDRLRHWVQNAREV